MPTKFIKMHGLGNDYVFFDLFQEKFPEDKVSELAIKFSDRHFGIGGDGIVLIKPSRKYDAEMQIFNADGSEAEMCGNAMRCCAKYLFETNYQNKTYLEVETLAGIIKSEKMKKLIKVNMGKPKIGLVKHKLEFAKSDFYEITTVFVGNPHCVIFVENVEEFPVKQVGSRIEKMTEIFPNRTNVEFVEIINRNELKMRVWERGSGETLACGTGAIASLVAASANKLSTTKATIYLRGGDLEVEWDLKTGHAFKTGVALKSFEGSVDFEDYLC